MNRYVRPERPTTVLSIGRRHVEPLRPPRPVILKYGVITSRLGVARFQQRYFIHPPLSVCGQTSFPPSREIRTGELYVSRVGRRKGSWDMYVRPPPTRTVRRMSSRISTEFHGIACHLGIIIRRIPISIVHDRVLTIRIVLAILKTVGDVVVPKGIQSGSAIVHTREIYKISRTHI